MHLVYFINKKRKNGWKTRTGIVNSKKNNKTFQSTRTAKTNTSEKPTKYAKIRHEN